MKTKRKILIYDRAMEGPVDGDDCESYLVIAQIPGHRIRIFEYFEGPGVMDRLFAAMQIALEAHCKLIDLLSDVQTAADNAGITDFDVGRLFQDALADRLTGGGVDA